VTNKTKEKFMQVMTEKRKDYIHAQVTGRYSFSAVQNLLVKSLDILIEKGFSKLLIDLSSINHNITTIERFLFGEFCAMQADRYRDKGLKYLKIAIFGIEPAVDSKRLGETVARNRGVDLKVTTDMSVALEFLGNSYI
jgi:hypothetical protein